MVRGIDTFKQYFSGFPESYVVIGGTACDVIIDAAGLMPRATKDIDLILVVEALTPDFVRQFWTFVQDGRYQRKEKSTDERKYYRFLHPEQQSFPTQVELFSRKPDVIELQEPAHITPIPAEEDLSSLSAILLSDAYYHYMLEHSTERNGLRIANTEALICLKAKAFLEIKERIAAGSNEDSRQIRKHKGDIFRLTTLLAPENTFTLPPTLKDHLQAFADEVATDLPDPIIFKEMGLPNTHAQDVFNQLKTSFELT